MKRIVSKIGDKTLVNVPGTDTWISKHFYEKGIMDPEKKTPRHKYSLHILIEEKFSPLMGEDYREWDIDGVKCFIFRSGVMYKTEEAFLYKDKPDALIKKAHQIKKIFSGTII